MEGEGRRRPTLSDQMALMESSKLRELLKERDGEDESEASRSVRRGENPAEIYHSRTLLDIIREEESSNEAYRLSGAAGHKIKWKSFKDRIRIRRGSAALSGSDQSLSVSGEIGESLPRLRRHLPDTLTPPEEPPGTPIPAMNGRTGVHRVGQSITMAADVAGNINALTDAMPVPATAVPLPVPLASAEDTTNPSTTTASDSQEEPTRVSLMTLLEEADRHSGIVGGESDGDKEDEEPEENEADDGEFVCCVCMVRHKGAAFIPCGHTFCRLCSRELWVSRGNCPLCNGYILEILDIF